MMLKPLFLQYLLMPIFVAIAASVMVVLRKKNQLLSNRKLIFFVLLSGLVMAVPGLFGLLPGSFTPWAYLVSQLLYVLLGVLFVQLYDQHFGDKVTRYAMGFRIALMSVIVLLGGYLFALLYNLLHPGGGGYTGATSLLAFFLPLLFQQTYLAFISIPFEIYKVWEYPQGAVEEISFDGMDFNKLMVLELEFSRQPDDADRLRVKAKAPADISLGDWFRKFIDDYNYKFPNSAIVYEKGDGSMHGWVFYCKKSFFHRRRLLDPGQTISQNKIEEHITITSKRVIEHNEEYFPKAMSRQTN